MEHSRPLRGAVVSGNPHRFVIGLSELHHQVALPDVFGQCQDGARAQCRAVGQGFVELGFDGDALVALAIGGQAEASRALCQNKARLCLEVIL